MTVSRPPEAGLLSLKWSSSNLSNLSTHPSMNQGRQAQGGQTPVIECTCRHKYLVRQARAGQTRTQPNMKLAMTTWQPLNAHVGTSTLFVKRGRAKHLLFN